MKSSGYLWRRRIGLLAAAGLVLQTGGCDIYTLQDIALGVLSSLALSFLSSLLFGTPTV